MKTVKFLTVGCKVNQYDTQVIREQFLNLGFKELENHLPADTYVINTCTVTHRADSDSLNLIRRAKRENPRAKIIVTGCLTELDKDKIKKVDSEVVIVKKKINGISYFKGHTRAFLKIQDGCNNFCSYCKVFLVRGRSQSRPLEQILPEAVNLVKNGFKEIVLSGICLGSYGKDLEPKISLVDVINALENIGALLRIRLSSIEAGDVSEELIHKIAQSKKVCRHLHIPIQSGDDEILKRMNRNYCRREYLNLIQKIKQQIPQIAITTDVLVGFPTETEIHFQNTLSLVKEICPIKVHIFPYSRRKGTPAADNFQDEVNPVVIKERILRLKNIARNCALIYKKQFLNQKMEVLIEGRSKENPDFWLGFTDNYIQVRIESEKDLKNQLITLQLKKINKDCMIGEL